MQKRIFAVLFNFIKFRTYLTFSERHTSLTVRHLDSSAGINIFPITFGFNDSLYTLSNQNQSKNISLSARTKNGVLQRNYLPADYVYIGM